MPSSPTSKNRESPPFTPAAISKIYALASLLDQDNGAAQQTTGGYGQPHPANTLAIQRISRAVLWGLRSSLGITPGNGTLALHLEGHIVYTRDVDDGDGMHSRAGRWDRSGGGQQYDRKEEIVYKGDKFQLV